MSEWQVKKLEEMTARELFAILYTRSEVFVVEQECVFQEPTIEDLTCLHVFKVDEKQDLVAYARIIDNEEYITFGRVITASKYRGTGEGQKLLTTVIAEINKRYPNRLVKIQAQAYLEKFYGSFGFKSVSDYYLEDDIKHIDMAK
ncbi:MULTISPECIES: GNAT family N-acetyltransferase [Brochothrix]|uniref:GNAT family N-acetyltransferase n=1 Tax=Brochothrix thermosphacta TaxID=2756 RepID=A0A1D2LNK5_BROTH|nr:MULTISPECIES: GNAT family N-acetyltransferase [Brochothrix]SLN02928.1 ElaA protein [Brachybacterium faecium]ATF25832.1 GNAT family N-acetyltransferase [Brochothrix thermosphacta]ATH85168.1 GNAT family N-acetyltransferase [Brochothrix thermosphacta]EUJ34693.1 acetyltransferase family protein [Brochothrix thermosphacta DSM 20171 = FSL F6-1036]MBR5525306.1 GNAT family N-acetyltransferase [Brochothrix sp.]